MVGVVMQPDLAPTIRLYGIFIIFMTSKERRDARYFRRKKKREENKRQKLAQCDDYDEVFTFEHLFNAYKKCCKGVGWKASTQRYKARAMINLSETLSQLKSGTFKSRGFYEFDIVERGKPRHIQSVHIVERVVQRCLCDYSLTPIFRPPLIHDNGACLEGKGVQFSEKRVKTHLRRYYQKHGAEGYCLTFDFSKYFDNIDHNILKSIIRKLYSDKRIIDLLCMLIDDFGGDKGLGLGSQISQICAVIYPTALDRYVKQELRIEFYGRYMDDGYLIHHDKQYLRICLNAIKKLCAELGIKLNTKKTQIVKLSNGFNFLKKRYRLTKTGKVLRLPSKKNITKRRRLLKKFHQRVSSGLMSFDNVLRYYNSSSGYFKQLNAYHAKRELDELFYKLFAKELQCLKSR